MRIRQNPLYLINLTIFAVKKCKKCNTIPRIANFFNSAAFFCPNCIKDVKKLEKLEKFAPKAQISARSLEKSAKKWNRRNFSLKNLKFSTKYCGTITVHDNIHAFAAVGATSYTLSSGQEKEIPMQYSIYDDEVWSGRGLHY